jgi:hypothetical protein
MDVLVTKDYLDECLDSRFIKKDAKFEQRFQDVGAWPTTTKADYRPPKTWRELRV